MRIENEPKRNRDVIGLALTLKRNQVKLTNMKSFLEREDLKGVEVEVEEIMAVEKTDGVC